VREVLHVLLKKLNNLDHENETLMETVKILENANVKYMDKVKQLKMQLEKEGDICMKRYRAKEKRLILTLKLSLLVFYIALGA
jgi:predicted transcriptional regulator